MAKHTNQKSLFYCILRLAVGGGVLYYLLTRYLFVEVISVVSTSNLGYFGFACVLSILFQISVLSRLKWLAEWRKNNISLYDAFHINLTASFYGLFLPAKNRTDGAIRFVNC